MDESFSTIGMLLGHRKVQTTARYAHLTQERVLVADERVAVSVEEDLGRR